MAASVRTASATDIGARAEQQDSVGHHSTPDGRCHLLVVADGMGGCEGGELASRTVVDVAARLWETCYEGGPDNPPAFLEALCHLAHDEIRSIGQARGISPYTTIVALLATSERAWWVHVGDSRVYGFRDSSPVWRTEDHTLVQNLIRTGRINESERLRHPDRNKLLRGLGGSDPVRTTHGQMQMTPQTGFVLCTDGFWAFVKPDEMPALLWADNPAQACREWVARAVERGGADADNATVAVLQPEARLVSARVDHRQLWPLYGALGVAVAILLLQTFR
jgi:PPM family protein phosphatase